MTQQSKPTPGTQYSVQYAISLWAIAEQAYTDGNNWIHIHEFNLQVLQPQLGDNPNPQQALSPVLVLYIPIYTADVGWH